jgi:hypothetical protein
MLIKLTKEMKLAIEVAIDELSNNGDWCDYLTDEECEEVFTGIKMLKRDKVIPPTR